MSWTRIRHVGSGLGSWLSHPMGTPEVLPRDPYEIGTDNVARTGMNQARPIFGADLLP